MRSPRGMSGPRRHVVRRHELNQGPIFRIDHSERGGTLGRRCREGAERASTAGGVVVAVARVEPDFVSGPRARHVCGGARLHIENHVLGRGAHRPRRVPHVAVRVEDLIAADQQIVTRTDGEAGRPAVLHRIGRVDHGRFRIDAHDRTVLRVRTYLRNGEKELAGCGMPHRLFGAVLCVNAMGSIKNDAAADGERARRLVDLDKGGEGRM